MGKTLVGFLIGIVLLPAIAAIVAFSGHVAVEATAKPPQWERNIANRALDAAVDRKAEGLTCPIPASEENLMKGMKLYRDDCAGCHGDRGKPSSWGRNNFYPPAPQLADRGVHDPVPNIFVVVKNGIRYTGMGGWKDEVPEDDIWRVSLFLHTLKTLPATVDSAWRHPAAAEPEAPGSAR